MDIWGKVFKKRRAMEAMVNRAIGAAEERARTPIGPRKSAEQGSQTRANIIAVVDEVEARIKNHAFVFAGEDREIMTSAPFEAAISNHPEGELLKAAFGLMFTTPKTKHSLLEHWDSAVDGFVGKPNRPDTLNDKAAILSSFILHRYDIPCLAANNRTEVLKDGIEEELKLEAAAGWYRIIDELAYRFIREDRDLFCDYLMDNLAYHLALQGCGVAAILERATERGQEYAQSQSWIGKHPHEDTGVLWIMACHGLVSLGISPIESAVRAHIELFLEALGRARIEKLLTGKLGLEEAASGADEAEAARRAHADNVESTH